MLRNLLYSISLHLLLILVMYTSTVLYKPKRYLDLNAESIKEMGQTELKEIKKNLSNNSKFSKLTLKQKIDLYENYNKLKSIKTEKYEQIKDKLKDNIIFSTKKEIPSNKTVINNTKDIEVPIVKTEDNLNKNDYVVVEKESHKVYVSESNFTKEEIDKINQQNENKEKIRKQIKKVDAVKNEKQESKKQESNKKEVKTDLNDFIDSLDKDLAAINDENKKEFKVVDTSNTITNETMDNLAEINELMKIDNLDELIRLKDNVNSKDIEHIFTKEDYEIMANNNKNSIYELSFREKSNIQKQIKICYKNAVLKTQKSSSIVMSAKISLDKSGQIDMNNIIFEIQNEENVGDIDKNNYFITVENIKLALVYCNPLRGLPTFKYNIWKNMNLTFNNN